ncbi:MAG: CPBP family intramembrane glutamic endopeptidase [Candidatus Hadarchaeales archaeon]
MPARSSQKTAKKPPPRIVEKPVVTNGPWWLGPLIVYICVLSAMLFASVIASAYGSEAISVYEMENGPPPIDNLFVTIMENHEPMTIYENLLSVFTVNFSNLSENSVTKTYSMRLGDAQTDFSITLRAWENSSVPVVMSVENLGYGFHELLMTDETTGENVETAWVLRWRTGREISDVLSHVVTFTTALVIVYLHTTRFEKRKFWPSVGVRRERIVDSIIWVFALSVIFTVIIYFYWSAVQMFTGTSPESTMRGFFMASADWYFIYLGFAFFFPVAFTEEIVFRGFIIERLSPLGAAKAVVISAALFASLHLWYLSFGAAGIFFLGGLFLIAVWWGIVYHKTRNVAGLILFHGLYNVVQPGTVMEHFWPEGGVAMQSLMFIFGVACLGYLIYLYLKKLFIEMEELVKR